LSEGKERKPTKKAGSRSMRCLSRCHYKGGAEIKGKDRSASRTMDSGQKNHIHRVMSVGCKGEGETIPLGKFAGKSKKTYKPLGLEGL